MTVDHVHPIFAQRTLLLLALFCLPSSGAATFAVPPQQVDVTFDDGEAPLDNPLKGWCPYTNAGQIHQPYSMVFLYVPWSELEPSPGDFRFEQWEEKSWNVKAAVGKHVLLRVYIDYPGRPSGMPAWLAKQGVAQTPYTDHGGGLSPDYDDPRMIAAMRRLILALGKRYNDHPRVAFLQLGILGFWGEWHTWPRGQMYAQPETEGKILDAFHKAFPDKSLMVRYARDEAGKRPWIGFHDDMFPQDTDNGQAWSFLEGMRRSGRTENWRTAVVGGEMVPHQATKWLTSDFATTKKMIRNAHFSWVGPYCPALQKSPSQSYDDHSRQMIALMGYNFRLRHLTHQAELAPDSRLSLSLRGENIGVAPFYYPWPVRWALLDKDGRVAAEATTRWDLRKWQPGPFQVSAKPTFEVTPGPDPADELSVGQYRLAIGIVDPWKKRPAIGFANDVPVVDGWSVLSNVTVAAPGQ